MGYFIRYFKVFFRCKLLLHFKLFVYNGFQGFWSLHISIIFQAFFYKWFQAFWSWYITIKFQAFFYKWFQAFFLLRDFKFYDRCKLISNFKLLSYSCTCSLLNFVPIYFIKIHFLLSLYLTDFTHFCYDTDYQMVFLRVDSDEDPPKTPHDPCRRPSER